MKKKQPKQIPLMPLWGLDGKMQDNSNPTEKDIAEAAAEMRGDRMAAGMHNVKRHLRKTEPGYGKSKS